MGSTSKDRFAHRRRRSSYLGGAALVVLLALGPAVYAVAAENVRPTASFSSSPAAPVTGEKVTFTSTSTDSDGRIVSQAWDLDNDGSYDDGTAATASRTFTSAASYTVRLAVSDDDGAWRTTSRSVAVTANGAPVAAFSAGPSDPETGQTVTLTSSSTDPDGRPLVEEWDLDNDGAFDDKTGRQATTTFAADGVRKVSLRVTDSGGTARTASRDITVRNRPPQSAFGMSATEADTGDPIDFSSTSSDPDGEIRSYVWDFDGDGAADATGSTARHSFADNGTPTVTLTVTDDDGASRAASRQVAVRNRAPSASFRYGPAAPLAGDEVVLTSTSTDRDGTVAEHRWDLDGDGAFDDATGAEVRTRFAQGSHMVALQVRDDDDAASAPAFTSIDVASRPGLSATGKTDEWTGGPVDLFAGTPSMLDPFPRVRISGVATRKGARLDLLSVRTTGRTSILVRCKGRGCPWKRKVQSARFSTSRVRVVRIPGFRRRQLRAGTVIELFVTREGAVGKYTRIKIRRLKPPKRLDGCAAPGAARTQRCPGS